MESHDHLASYSASAAILIMRRSLRSAGWWSIFWGCLWLGVLLLEISAGTATWVNYLWFGLGGALLLVEGIFVIRSFSSLALKAEAITLALFGVLNLYYFGMAVTGKSKGRANPLFGVIMLVNAYTTWKASATVDELMSKTNEIDLAFMTQLVDGIMNAKPKDSPDLILLKQSGMVVSNPEWRMKVVDGNAFLVNMNPGVFGTGKRAISVDIIPARSLQFDINGETWISNKAKCRLTIDGQPTDKRFEIERGMLDKVQMQGIAATAGQA